MSMGQIICVTSLKGGVGKTTTAVNLSTAFAMAEKKSLLVDCDLQGNATTGMGIDKSRLSRTLYHAMTGKASVQDSIIGTEIEFLKIIPARFELFKAETELRARREKEMILRNLLSDLKQTYDYIVIDSPPSLSLLTVNALTAADSLLIPLQCEFFAMEGVGRHFKMIQFLKNRFNTGVKIAGILLSMVKPEEDICRRISEALRHRFQSLVLRTVIPRDVGLRESASRGKPLLLADMMAIGAQRFLDLAAELMNRERRSKGEGIS